MVYLRLGRGWWCSSQVPCHILLMTPHLPFSTSTPWPPPSSRRCFSQIPLPAQPFTSCSMTSFSLPAISLPASPSPASPFHRGFQSLPVAWTPATGSLSPSSIKVNQSVGRQPCLPQCGQTCLMQGSPKLSTCKRMQFLQRAIKGSSRRRGMPVSIIVLIYIAVGSRKGQYTSKGLKPEYYLT